MLCLWRRYCSTQNIIPLTVNNPPTADFSFLPTTGCINEPVTLTNQSCLHDITKPIQWNYGDNTTGTLGMHTYTNTGTYSVKMKVENECGVDEKTKSITIVGKPQAEIRLDSGFIKPSYIINEKDTAKICLSSGGGVKFKGDESLNETNYKWELSPSGGWSQKFPFLSNLFFWRVGFSNEGVYTLKLTVDNECNKPSTRTIYVKVVKAVALNINPQDDVCNPLNYTPSPFIKEAKYYIDGVLVANFPLNLGIRTNPYKIEAKLSNECGSQVVQDEFFVNDKVVITISSPKDNATFCQGAQKILLEATPTGGVWIGSNVIKQGNDYYFDPSQVGNTTLTYSVGTGSCEQKSNVKVNVVKDLVVNLYPKQDDVCNPLSYKPSNFDAKITYKINGNVVSSFPITLPISPTPYIVTAEYNGLCGNQSKADTFTVDEPKSAKIIFPSKDTTLCESNIPILMKTEVVGGVFSGATSINGNNFTPNQAGDFTITYTIGSGTCKKEESVKIKVVKDLVVNLYPKQDDVCNPLSQTVQKRILR